MMERGPHPVLAHRRVRGRVLGQRGQIGRESRRRRIRRLQGAGGVEHDVREPSLLRGGHLGRNARPGRRLLDPVPRHQAAELLAAFAVHHHQPVEAQVEARLHEESGVGHEDAAPGRGVGGGAARLLFAHARVHEGVELGARRRVREDASPEDLPVDRPVRGQDPAPEGRHHVPVGGTAGRHHLVGHAVEVEGAEAGRGQVPTHARLAAGDAAGEADPQHGRA